MSWSILEAVEVFFDALELFSSNDSKSQNLGYSKPQKTRSKKNKYATEKISLFFTLLASIFLLIMLKDPLPVEHPFQAVAIAFLIGISFAFMFGFRLHIINLFYFRNLFSMLFFCISLIALCTAVVLYLYLYFESGLF